MNHFIVGLSNRSWSKDLNNTWIHLQEGASLTPYLSGSIQYMPELRDESASDRISLLSHLVFLDDEYLRMNIHFSCQNILTVWKAISNRE